MPLQLHVLTELGHFVAMHIDSFMILVDIRCFKHGTEGALSTYHNNSRRTEAALAAVTDRNPLLDRVGFLDITQSFNSDDMLSINRDERSNTGIDRSVVYFLRRLVKVRNDLCVISPVNKLPESSFF